jgi:hypothetical protein
MKYIKSLSCAIAIAFALAVFAGASSASATVLCKVEGTGSPTGTTCPSGQEYTGEIHAVNTTTVKLDTTFKTVECSGSTVGGTANAGSATTTVTGPEGTLTFTGCNCTVTVLKAGTLEIHWISGTHNGTVTSNGLTVTILCSTIFGNVHCAYVTSNTVIGVLTASAMPLRAIIHWLVVLIPEPTNALCSEESTLTASYEVTTPNPLYVTGHT